MEDHGKKDQRKHNPLQKTSIISKIFFCWTLPIFFKGYKKKLNEDDLHQPLPEHESKFLGDKLEKTWTEECMTNKHPSLWKALAKVFGKEMAIYGIVIFIQEMIKISQPLFIGKFLSFYAPNQTNVTKKEAYIYASCVVLASFLNVLIIHSYMFGVQHMGLKLRIACCSLIYRKALKLSKSTTAETTTGQMVNLLSNDVSRFDYSMVHFHNLWLSPIEAGLIMYLLFNFLGYTALTGILVLFFFVPLQSYMGKKTSEFRFKTAVRTDDRVRLMNEIISGIQIIKIYAWEIPFSVLVQKARKLEIRQIQNISYIRAINVSFLTSLIRISIFLCILCYILTSDQGITAEYVYTLTAYYGILRQTVCMGLPQGITSLAECNISVRRIQKFLMCDEVNVTKSENNKAITGFVSLKNVTAKWLISAENTLNNINLTVTKSELVAIVGTVGCGKSSLLHVILKELPLLEGNLIVNGTISYASQEPWLFSGSIRQNILFGQIMDVKKYWEVIRVCALERDLNMFPYRDRTIVGERGVMLSGGQKARINLARAVYKEADIYLLDDPLSAVDTHVGKNLFNECISGYLKDKCVILVTHQIQYLKTVNRIYLMENGNIKTSGTYDELQSSGINFLKLINEHESNEEVIEDKKSVRKIEKFEETDKPMETKEQKSVGKILMRVYTKYLLAGGNWFVIFLVFASFAITQFASSGSDYFITFWVNLEQKRIMMNTTENMTEEEIFDDLFFTPYNCIYIYTAILIFIIGITLTRSICFFKFCMRASSFLHNNMFSKIVYAPMRFFNTNPSGRILNRFSKDIGSIDDLLPNCLMDTIQIGLVVLGITIVTALVNPWIFIPSTLLLVFFYFLRIFYLATSTNVKRMEGITKSPIFNQIIASVQGLTTIRAFGCQEVLKQEFDNHQNLHSSAYFTFVSVTRTFGFWLDFTTCFYIGMVTYSFLLIGNEIYGGNVGLAITQSIALTGMLQWGMRQWSELENQMTSVERVLEYTEVVPEKDTTITNVPKSWPEHGQIEFQSVSLKYSETDPFVLRNLTFKINPREKVGIVGRTGAGKSSLIAALFRLANIEGKILIDSINTKEISLKILRSNIAIIPQEPILFSGTLRNNLDPFDEFQDSQLWTALEEVELKNYVTELPSGLSSKVTEGGLNFSVGQRQLLCLARTVIRHNRILVLDEATANVDPQTDELIQKTIRTKFENCTVLTIAHRLHTVMDSDKILVMDMGEVAEFDHPHLLLQNVNGVFYGLVKQTGKAMAENLMKISRDSYNRITKS